MMQDYSSTLASHIRFLINSLNDSNSNSVLHQLCQVVITSIHIDGSLFLIGSSKKNKDQAPEQFKIMIPKILAYFTGTGDLTTALLLGWSNKYPDNLAKSSRACCFKLAGTFVEDDQRLQKCRI